MNDYILKKKRKKKLIKKRYIFLLEILIAFFIIVIAVLPLIYPHIFMYQQQVAFIKKIEQDRQANQEYAKIIEQLYLNEIPITAIEEEKEFTLEGGGTYRFEVEKYKPKVKEEGEEKAAYTLYLVNLTITIEGTNYVYKIFIERNRV